MKNKTLRSWQVLLWLFTILVLFASSFSSFSSARASKLLIGDPPANQVAVKLKYSWESINTILARYGATLVGSYPENSVYMLQLASGQTADQMLPTLSADSDILAAEPNYYAEVGPDGTRISVIGTRISVIGTGGLTPTPAGGADQWAWQKIGLADAQKISDAQSTVSGRDVVVAMLDTGMVGNHPLSQSNIVAGYDFVTMSSNFLDAGNGIDDDGNGAIDDFVGHGTHISGIIVTTAPKVRIMPIRVLNSDGVGTYWEVSQGIRYAVDHGANIINMSLTAPRLTPSLSSALAYAAAHGVIVVAAAGNNDPGPNYPADYSDPLAVIGVGASDRNDAIASFSGGLPVDTDVFAPGVDIYSSYPYNGYALGTGTSMAAPIVSGEAALLIANHPDWSAAEVEQRIISKGASVSGSSAKRVDLAAALNTGIEVDAGTLDPSASATDAYIAPRLRLVNNTPLDIPLSELKLRYWYTADTGSAPQFTCDYGTPINCSALTIGATFTSLASGNANLTSLSDTYAEVSFPASAGNLAAGTFLEMYLKIYKADYSFFNELNDFSYLSPTLPVMTRWHHITAYRNGTLVWGVEPTSSTILTSTPTRTPTLYVPTATYTKTATSSAPTATYTKAATSAAPTATYTKTKTPTAAAPTATVAAATATLSKTSTSAPSFTKTPTVAASATRTNTPAPTATHASSSCTVITGGGTLNITTTPTCFKYVNTSWTKGGIFNIGNWASSNVNTVSWYGGSGEASTSCGNNTQNVSGNGAQLSNFSVARDVNGAMIITITGTNVNNVTISMYMWQNGTGCSTTPTPSP